MEKSLENIEKKAEMTADKLFKIGKSVIGFIATVIAANEPIGQAIAEAREIARLDEFASSVGSTIEDVNALNNTIISLGGDRTGVEENISVLFKSVQEAAKNSNSEIAKTFKSLGIDIKESNGEIRNLFATMGDLSESVSRMDERKAQEFMKALGITDRSTIELMMKGRDEFNQMIRAQKAASPINAESAKKSVEFTKALGELKIAFGNLKSSIAIMAVPALTFLMKNLSVVFNWMRDNKPFVVAFFTGVAAVVTKLYLPAMIKAAATTLAFLAPWLPIIAALAVAALAIDDVTRYLQGHDSVLGRTINTLREMSPAYAAASDAFSTWVGDMIDIAKEKWPAIKKILTAVITKEDWNNAQDSFSVFINDLIDDAKAKIQEWKDDFSVLINDLIDDVKAKVQEWKDGFVDIINTAVMAVVDIFKSLLAEFEAIFEKIMSGFNTIANAKNKIVDGANTWLMDKAGVGDSSDSEVEKEGRKQLIERDGWIEDENGNLLSPKQQKKNISLVNSQDIQALGAAASEVTATAQSPIMQNKQGIMNSINNSNTNNNRSIKIDKIEVKTQATDAGGLVNGLRRAFDEMFTDELRNLQTDSTGIK